ncbi:MAG: hypothetical protein IT430_07860 [Phycisphaerales bacterium]|nr:hypothetical protein [Phycisphaerales bacterium]
MNVFATSVVRQDVSGAVATEVDALNDENSHITMEVLEPLLRPSLEALELQLGPNLSLSPLGRLKPGIDSTTKGLIENGSGEAVAVVVCSRPSSPLLVARGTERAERIRSMLGERLGAAIIAPIYSGVIDGRSYVVLPVARDLPSNRLVLRWRLWSLRRTLLDWLADAVRAAAIAQRITPQSDSQFSLALSHLGSQAFLDSATKTAVNESLNRLHAGQWSPLHTFDHNDLWYGNILQPLTSAKRDGTKWPFVLIDWAGANPRGYGVYDLIRLSRSLQLSSARLGRELVRHARALECEPADLRGHFLASMGHLHRHLEHFPLERFVEVFKSCWLTLDRGLDTVPSKAQ